MRSEMILNRVALTILSCAALPLAADTSAKGEASVTLIHPIDIKKDTDLSFGGIVGDGKAGLAVLDLDGNLTCTDCKKDGADRQSTGNFTISGITKMHYQVQFDPTIDLKGPHGDSLNIKISTIRLNKVDEEIKAGGLFTSKSIAMPASGQSELILAGSLQIPANAQGGEYKGPENVQVLIP